MKTDYEDRLTLIEWVNEWVSELLSEWVSERVSDSVNFTRLKVMRPRMAKI